MARDLITADRTRAATVEAASVVTTDAVSAAPAPTRRRLPNRRLTETRHVVHRTPDGRETPLAVSIGYDPAEPARPREVFYDAGYRSGAELEFAVQDLCVVLSLLLQHGVEARDRPLAVGDPRARRHPAPRLARRHHHSRALGAAAVGRVRDGQGG